MSSTLFIDALTPSVSETGVTLGVTNVTESSTAAGFTETFAVIYDQENNQTWVNPTPFIPVLVDGLKQTRADLVNVQGAQQTSDMNVASLQSQLTDLTASLAEANSRITTVDSHMQALVNALALRIGALETGVSTTTNRFDELDGRVTAANAHANNVAAELTEAKTALQSNLDQIAEQYGGRLNTIEPQIVDLTTRVGALESQAGMTSNFMNMFQSITSNQ